MQCGLVSSRVSSTALRPKLLDQYSGLTTWWMRGLFISLAGMGNARRWSLRSSAWIPLHRRYRLTAYTQAFGAFVMVCLSGGLVLIASFILHFLDMLRVDIETEARGLDTKFGIAAYVHESQRMLRLKSTRDASLALYGYDCQDVIKALEYVRSQKQFLLSPHAGDHLIIGQVADIMEHFDYSFLDAEEEEEKGFAELHDDRALGRTALADVQAALGGGSTTPPSKEGTPKQWAPWQPHPQEERNGHHLRGAGRQREEKEKQASPIDRSRHRWKMDLSTAWRRG